MFPIIDLVETDPESMSHWVHKIFMPSCFCFIKSLSFLANLFFKVCTSLLLLDPESVLLYIEQYLRDLVIRKPFRCFPWVPSLSPILPIGWRIARHCVLEVLNIISLRVGSTMAGNRPVLQSRQKFPRLMSRLWHVICLHGTQLLYSFFNSVLSKVLNIQKSLGLNLCFRFLCG
jgi:hypothetical protein